MRVEAGTERDGRGGKGRSGWITVRTLFGFFPAAFATTASSYPSLFTTSVLGEIELPSTGADHFYEI